MGVEAGYGRIAYAHVVSLSHVLLVAACMNSEEKGVRS